MIVYHVDKMRSLVPGQTIEPLNRWTYADSFRQQRIQALNRLYGGKLSFFGIQSLDNFPGKTTDLEMTELMLDYIRSMFFPKLPSRFTVLFASRTVEDARQWFSPLSLHDFVPHILALETTDQVFAANVLFRDEVNNRVADICKELLVHQKGKPSNLSDLLSSFGSNCLVQCMNHALAYWESVTPVNSSDEPALFEREELLLIPPVHVLGQVDSAS